MFSASQRVPLAETPVFSYIYICARYMYVYRSSDYVENGYVTLTRLLFLIHNIYIYIYI